MQIVPVLTSACIDRYNPAWVSASPLWGQASEIGYNNERQVFNRLFVSRGSDLLFDTKTRHVKDTTNNPALLLNL